MLTTWLVAAAVALLGVRAQICENNLNNVFFILQTPTTNDNAAALCEANGLYFAQVPNATVGAALGGLLSLCGGTALNILGYQGIDPGLNSCASLGLGGVIGIIGGGSCTTDTGFVLCSNNPLLALVVDPSLITETLLTTVTLTTFSILPTTLTIDASTTQTVASISLLPVTVTFFTSTGSISITTTTTTTSDTSTEVQTSGQVTTSETVEFDTTITTFAFAAAVETVSESTAGTLTETVTVLMDTTLSDQTITETQSQTQTETNTLTLTSIRTSVVVSVSSATVTEIDSTTDTVTATELATVTQVSSQTVTQSVTQVRSATVTNIQTLLIVFTETMTTTDLLLATDTVTDTVTDTTATDTTATDTTTDTTTTLSCPTARLASCPCAPDKSGYIIMYNKVPYEQAACACERVGAELAVVPSRWAGKRAGRVLKDCNPDFHAGAWVESDDNVICYAIFPSGSRHQVPCGGTRQVLCRVPLAEVPCHSCQFIWTSYCQKYCSDTPVNPFNAMCFDPSSSCSSSSSSSSSCHRRCPPRSSSSSSCHRRCPPRSSSSSSCHRRCPPRSSSSSFCGLKAEDMGESNREDNHKDKENENDDENDKDKDNENDNDKDNENENDNDNENGNENEHDNNSSLARIQKLTQPVEKTAMGEQQLIISVCPIVGDSIILLSSVLNLLGGLIDFNLACVLRGGQLLDVQLGGIVDATNLLGSCSMDSAYIAGFDGMAGEPCAYVASNGTVFFETDLSKCGVVRGVLCAVDNILADPVTTVLVTSTSHPVTTLPLTSTVPFTLTQTITLTIESTATLPTTLSTILQPSPTTVTLINTSFIDEITITVPQILTVVTPVFSIDYTLQTTTVVVTSTTVLGYETTKTTTVSLAVVV